MDIPKHREIAAHEAEKQNVRAPLRTARDMEVLGVKGDRDFQGASQAFQNNPYRVLIIYNRDCEGEMLERGPGEKVIGGLHLLIRYISA